MPSVFGSDPKRLKETWSGRRRREGNRTAKRVRRRRRRQREEVRIGDKWVANAVRMTLDSLNVAFTSFP